jgi:glutaredoxin
MKITLYTGPNCGLCELALTLIHELEGSVELEEVNVRDSVELYHLYGARIPVVKKHINEEQDSLDKSIHSPSHVSPNELGWPFSLIQLRAFLS